MPVYRFADTLLESAVPLPELRVVPNGPAQLIFRLASEGVDGAVRWYHDLRNPDGTLRVSIGRREDRYIIRFHRLADFLVEGNGRSLITCRPCREVADRTIRHLLLDQVLPTLLNGDGRIALHASAVLTTAGVVAFAGPSGSGKSTLAAGFWAAGDTLVTDDTLLVGRRSGSPEVWPVYPSLRLWSDAAAALLPREADGAPPVAAADDKVRVTLHSRDAAIAPTPLPLVAVYLVTPAADSRVRVERIPRSKAFRALLGHVYRLDPFDRTAIASEMDLLHALVSFVDVKTLSVPHGFARLADVRRVVLGDLVSLAGSSQVGGGEAAVV